jgi:tripartite ATP-independent transporter DctP family solute receptor
MAGAVPAAVAQGRQVSLRISSSMPPDRNAAHFVWFEQFRTRLAAAVGDRVKLDYFPNSQLGKEADVVQQVKVGSIDMMISGSSIWATVAPEIGMLDLGYLFDSFPHVARSLDAGAGSALAKIVSQKSSADILGWGFSFGARNVYTRKEVTSLAQLKDVKLRVLPAPAFIETFKIMGAIPTPIPVNELYTALQTGVVDGFEHDAGTALAQKFYEVTNHCFLTEHLFSPIVATIGKRGIDKIAPDIRDVFLKAAADATLEQRKTAVTAANEALDQLRQLGVKVASMPKQDRDGLLNEVSGKLHAPFAEKHPETKPIFDMVSSARNA